MTIKKKISCILLLVFSILSVLLFSVSSINAYAQTETNKAEIKTEEAGSETRGIYTSLSIAINGGDGKVWVTVKNDITIFPATVRVIVELYSSDTYQESYENMQLESRVATEDLDMGNTITAQSSTGGEQKYWLGRTRYRIDAGQWEEMNTGTYLCDEEGNCLGFGI